MKLTVKQEKFIQGIVSGLSQREAYKQAYNTTKMKDKTIDNKACVLFNKGEIRARYEELIEEFKDKALYTRESAVSDLVWIKDNAKKDIQSTGLRQANGTIFINAIKELGELNDLYPTKKQDVTVNGKMEVDNPYKDLTTEQLMKIIGEEIK